MIQTDHDKYEDDDNADRNVREHNKILGKEQAPPKRFKDYEVYVTVEEEDKFMLIGGPMEKLSFFQTAPGPILSGPNHSNSSQYDPCKVWLKNNDHFLTCGAAKVDIFCVLVTELVTDLSPLETDHVLVFPRL